MDKDTMLDLMRVPPPPLRLEFNVCQLLIEIVLSRDQTDDE